MKFLGLTKNQLIGVLTVIVMIVGIYFTLPTTQQTHSGNGDNVGRDQYNTTVYDATTSLANTLSAMESQIAQANQIANAAMYASIVQSGNSSACSSGKMVNRLPGSVYDLNDQYFASFLKSGDDRLSFNDRVGLAVVERGYVDSHDVYPGGIPYVDLRRNPKDYFSIRCEFSRDWAKTIAALEIGKQVSYCGWIADYAVGVRLSGCELLE